MHRVLALGLAFGPRVPAGCAVPRPAAVPETGEVELVRTVLPRRQAAILLRGPPHATSTSADRSWVRPTAAPSRVTGSPSGSHRDIEEGWYFDQLGHGPAWRACGPPRAAKTPPPPPRPGPAAPHEGTRAPRHEGRHQAARLLAAGDPGARSARPGTPRRPSGASTTSPTPCRPGLRRPARHRPPERVVPARGALPRPHAAPLVHTSPRGTRPRSPTARPKRPTTRSNGSSASASRSAGSATIGSGHCSTPGDPTGHYSPRSHPAESEEPVIGVKGRVERDHRHVNDGQYTVPPPCPWHSWWKRSHSMML
jgi:hypothetical protein